MQQSHPFVRAAVLALVLVMAFMATLEVYWRNRGFIPTHNDDKMLWAHKRKEIYKPAESTTVVIGGSRIKFDLDIATWEKLTGDEIVQLAIVGTPARPVLRHLAEDPNFKGKVIIDVMEPQFFTLDSIRRESSAVEAIAAYTELTPAQKANNSINYALESQFVFLEEGKFAINPLLDDLRLGRPGVWTFPVFPKEFEMTTAERQTFMTEKFLQDTSLQNWQRRIWGQLILSRIDKDILQGKELDFFMSQIRSYIKTIVARGGSVVFVRPPSSGPLLEAEMKHYPREQFWEPLLKFTNTPGIHFADDPVTASFNCPEWSHLSAADAVTYTESLVKALEQKAGWTFPNRRQSSSLQKP